MGKGVAKREDKAWKKVQKAEKRKAALGKVHADDKTTQSKSSEGHAKVAKATGDQRYMNKLFASLSIEETEGPPEIAQEELDKMTEAAKERHLFLHEKAVAAYHEEKARKKASAWKMLHKEDKFGFMSVADIIKEEPMAVTAFRSSKTFKNANGLGSYSCMWNNSGSMILTTGHDRSVSLWRPFAVNGLPARKLKGHKGWTIQACFSPDDKNICCCSSDEMYIWDPTNGTLKAEWEAHDAMINGCQWSNTGRYIVSCSNDLTAKVWSAKKAISKGKKGAAVVHHDEEDEEDEHKHHKGVPAEFTLPMEGERGHSSAIIKAAFSHDDSFVITAAKDNLLIMWNLKTKGCKDRVFQGHQEAVLNIAINHDSSRMASCDNSGMIIVWDPKVETPVHMLHEHTDICYVVIFCREAKEGRGRIISAGHDGRILVWNTYEGTLIGETKSQHSSWITSAHMDTSNLKLITAGMDSKLIIWQSLPPAPKQYEWVERAVRFFKKLERGCRL
ncbi:hypothetical protein TrST_g8044 [Triparma strigata]|uniref:Guanine nucleotide-binding protein subunit beta-like protein n=1 Tax=Triparma strigata TaxID=1606541 RepID=A0A9W7EC35_9STRA|nr:hypothetical protein TrST_g8044 [Triparma strigata]